MRGRKIRAGDSSCILFMRHKTSCREYGNNSPTLECDCIKVVQFRHGSRRSTHERKWPKAEDAARRMLRDRLGLMDIPPAKPEATASKTTPWSGRRMNASKNGEQDGINNVKAVYLTKRLVAALTGTFFRRSAKLSPNRVPDCDFLRRPGLRLLT
jgi:hypothetical protein